MSEGKHEQHDSTESAPTPEEVRVLQEKIELLIERAHSESRWDGEAHLHLMLNLWNILEPYRQGQISSKELETRQIYARTEKWVDLLQRYFNLLDKYPEQAEGFRNKPISAYPYLEAMMIQRDETKGDKSQPEAWIDEMERHLSEDGKL